MAKKRELVKRLPREHIAPSRRQLTKSSDFFSIYANDLQVQTSPWDLRLTLGELGEPESTGDATILNIKQLGEVRMSPQLAKRLVLILAEHLTSYEATFGEIPGFKE